MPGRYVGDSIGLSKQDGLIVLLLALGAPDQAAHLSQADSFELGSDLIRRVQVAFKLDFVTEPTVCRSHVALTFAGLETDEQVASWAQYPGDLREDARLAGRRRVDEYHSMTPAKWSAGYGRSVSEPTVNTRSQWSRRAMATMPEDKSTPSTRHPRSAR